MTAPRALAALVLALLALPSVASARLVDTGFEPRTWRDARDAGGAPLDLRAVSFDQREAELWLRVRTEGEWAAGELGEDGLCVVLRRARSVLGRLCLGGDGRGGAVLRFRGRAVPAVVVRRDRRSVFARVHPRALRLRFGRVRWSVESRWSGGGAGASSGAPVGSGSDRAPERGPALARIGALGQPRCFGAAARAGARGCVNRALLHAVIPSPADAILSPDFLCRRSKRPAGFTIAELCELGYRDEPGPPQVALVGDSHAAHWRAALEVVAQARGWPAVSITHAGCAFSTEVYPAPAPIPGRCRRHTSESVRWLRAHPSVHTLITSSSAGRGLGVGGFLAQWRRVPGSVRRIYVIRDVPRARLTTAACVLRVRRRHARSSRACAFPRAGAFPADPSAAAARVPGDRARLVDLSRHFCDAARCFPVVGGAYVYKDDNHMNTVFATTLGPYLLRAMSG
ncbi:MAG TPA: SGNH hydrolase domain-containing protein [Solirubrobacteraceae bacterium]